MRAGAERGWSSVGRPWGPPQTWRLGRGDVHRLIVRPGAWQSGLYFARLTAPGGRAVAFAPFILRAAVPGVNRIAIVLPTYTWQAYNFYDANGDGKPDSWYGDPKRHSVSLGRPVPQLGQAAALPHAAARVPASAARAPSTSPAAASPAASTPSCTGTAAGSGAAAGRSRSRPAFIGTIGLEYGRDRRPQDDRGDCASRRTGSSSRRRARRQIFDSPHARHPDLRDLTGHRIGRPGRPGRRRDVRRNTRSGRARSRHGHRGHDVPARGRPRRPADGERTARAAGRAVAGDAVPGRHRGICGHRERDRLRHAHRRRPAARRPRRERSARRTAAVS